MLWSAITGTSGPYESVLIGGFGRVIALVVGAFSEVTCDVHLLMDLEASAVA